MSDKFLVTGGTGSFGRTMVEHLAGLFTERGISEIRVFSRDELKQDAMRQELASPRITYHLGDVRDYGRVREVMKDIDYVFHAAALKQVPSCETHPLEAIKTNVLGADNVMRAAAEADVQCCVVLSTDKAVYPISTMGTSKAMMEKLMLDWARRTSYTRFCATRYGNVMESRGSVIPLFVKQILAGKSITVTEPRMTRFLMSLKDSVDLVLHAFEHGESGDIWVRKAPACTIGDLAHTLSALIAPHLIPAIKTVGGRPGEKLCETLISEEEWARTESHIMNFRIRPDRGNSLQFDTPGGYNSHNTRQMNRVELAKLLETLPCVQEAIKCSK